MSVVALRYERVDKPTRCSTRYQQATGREVRCSAAAVAWLWRVHHEGTEIPQAFCADHDPSRARLVRTRPGVWMRRHLFPCRRCFTGLVGLFAPGEAHHIEEFTCACDCHRVALG